MANDDVYTRFKASVDMGMGIIYMVVSYYATQTAFIVEQYGLTLVFAISALFFLYGLFRIYRGYVVLRSALKTKKKPQDLMARFRERQQAIRNESPDAE